MRKHTAKDKSRAQLELAGSAIIFVVVSILIVQTGRFFLTGASAEVQPAVARPAIEFDKLKRRSVPAEASAAKIDDRLRGRIDG